MPDIVSDVALEAAAVYLNDPNQQTYTTTKLLPVIKSVYRRLQQKLAKAGSPTFKEISGVLTLKTPKTTFDGAAGTSAQPTDLIVPLWLGERDPGSTLPFIEMSEEPWEPEEQVGATLQRWIWREDLIQFLGATADREVKVRYRKSLPAIVDGTSSILIPDSMHYMGARVAEIVSATWNKNEPRAAYCNGVADEQEEEIISRVANKNQSLVFRRKGFRRPSRMF